VSIIVEWMTSLLNWLHGVTSLIGLESYGVAIILLTIIIKTLIYPLTWKQMASMRKTVEIQPKVKELQTKYKNDPQKLNAEIMELYKKNNVNPAGGCLPIVIQLPIFWALYTTLYRFNIADPSQAHFLWFNLADKDPFYILALLAAGTTFLQTKLTSPNASTDPTQKTMLYIMPVFFGYISATVPSGLALYWVTMNIVSIVQQLYINRKLDKQKAQAA
jgi:YidC/Oxa1 family membrane protein insertase